MSENFELLRNVTIGQYIPTGSVVHRLDPRAKILAFLCILLAVSFSNKVVPVAVLLIAILLISQVSRIPASYVLRGIVLGFPVLALVFALQFIFQGRAGAHSYGRHEARIFSESRRPGFRPRSRRFRLSPIPIAGQHVLRSIR